MKVIHYTQTIVNRKKMEGGFLILQHLKMKQQPHSDFQPCQKQKVVVIGFGDEKKYGLYLSALKTEILILTTSDALRL